MADSVLPATKLDALLVVVPAALSVLFGAAPKTDHALAKWTTVGSNVYAIATSVLTLNELSESNPELYEDAAKVLYILVGTTIITSASIILGVFKRLALNSWVVFASCGASALALVLGLVFLYRFFVAACVEDPGETALCNHERVTVVAVCASIGVGGLLLSVANAIRIKRDEPSDKSVYQDQEAAELGWGDETNLPAVALMGRVSAVAKAAVVGAFWFLVDDAMAWGDLTTQGAFWWVTGQVAKHLSALANNGFNEC